MKKILLTITAALGVTACQNQGGNPAPPPGCRLLDTGVLRCDAPYAGADFCCETVVPAGSTSTEPYTCWSAPEPAPQYACDGAPFDPNAGSGGVADSGSSTGGAPPATTGPSCTAQCPEDADGLCPGHASWSTGVMVWGVYRPNAADGTPDMTKPATVLHLDPVCAPSTNICFDYMDPADIPASEALMDAQLMENCADLTGAELAGLGFPATTPVGANGHTRVSHFCSTTNALNADYDGQSFMTTATSAEAACLGTWSYDGFCGGADCPYDSPDPGSVDSTGTGGGYLLDDGACQVMMASGPFQPILGTRMVELTPEASDILIANPYETIFDCLGAKINDSMEIWDFESNGLAAIWGLHSGDRILKINGQTNPTAIADMLLLELADEHAELDIKVARGWRRPQYFTYKVIIEGSHSQWEFADEETY